MVSSAYQPRPRRRRSARPRRAPFSQERPGTATVGRGKASEETGLGAPLLVPGGAGGARGAARAGGGGGARIAARVGGLGAAPTKGLRGALESRRAHRIRLLALDRRHHLGERARGGARAELLAARGVLEEVDDRVAQALVARLAVGAPQHGG